MRRVKRPASQRRGQPDGGEGDRDRDHERQPAGARPLPTLPSVMPAETSATTSPSAITGTTDRSDGPSVPTASSVSVAPSQAGPIVPEVGLADLGRIAMGEPDAVGAS